MKFVFAFLLPLLLYSLTYFAPPGKIEKFDHFWFVLTWPPSFCEENVDRCRPATLNFTIHGLWPTDAEGNTLNTSMQPDANISFINDTSSPLVRNLNDYWPTFCKDRTNEWLWEHEWKKHGCTQAQVEPEDYFEKAVTLITNTISRNILSALIVGGLEPGDSRYQVSGFISVISNITGTGTVMLRCKNETLQELRLCVKDDAFTECSGKKEKNKTLDSCGSQGTYIRFPAPPRLP
ncbi:hypothetical protein Ddye_000491 [Dipteronia dyeriana]|uniref:Uncharacterized protein n=1 Tax=Dipteronia dyeriana TaxID=168575 RepID=A0AAE0CSL2_9ROSI|nr:hypothetical protein Ddye_000491 [Dipteronia dyeriana]